MKCETPLQESLSDLNIRKTEEKIGSYDKRFKRDGFYLCLLYCVVLNTTDGLTIFYTSRMEPFYFDKEKPNAIEKWMLILVFALGKKN
jgi:hypothetical protein